MAISLPFLTRNANDLQYRFNQVRTQMGQMTPHEQVKKAMEVVDDVELLTRLQINVQAACRGQFTDVEHLSTDQLNILCEKLAMSATILEEIDDNKTVAFTYGQLASEFERVIQSPNFNVTEINDLKGRVSQILTSNSSMNRGNREALFTLQETLQAFTPSASVTTQSRLVGEPSVGTETANHKLIRSQNEDYQAALFTDQFSTITSDAASNTFDRVLSFYKEVKKYSLSQTSYASLTAGPKIAQLLQQAQVLLEQKCKAQADLEAQQSQEASPVPAQENHMEILKALQQEITQGIAAQNIPARLTKLNELYSKLSTDEKEKFFAEFNLAQKQFSKRDLSPALVGQPLANWTNNWPMLKQAVDQILVTSANSAPVVIMNSPAVVQGAPQTDALLSQIEIFKEMQQIFKQDIGTSNNSNMASNMAKINQIYQKLSSEAKEELFKEVSLAQKQRTQRELAQPMKKQPFHLWQATWKQKELAIDKMISTLTNSAPQVAANSAPVVVKKAEAMRQAMNEAINMQQQVPSSPNRPINQAPSTRPNQEPSALAGMYVPDDFDISTLGDPINHLNLNAGTGIHLTLTPIYTLQELIGLLQSNSTTPDRASQVLRTLESTKAMSVFMMTGPAPSPIADRPFYHLYFIIKNEAPTRLRDDMNFGRNAFSGVYPVSNEERSRAVKRTIVECILGCLEDAINFDDGATVIQLLNTLEDVKLSAQDRAEGQETPAYNLFQAFYNLHKAARNSDTTLIDPHENRFDGDFGRHGFRSSRLGIDPAIKLEAIQQVLKALRVAWKL